jgi:TPP-dependent pyruvate/acetoin dehydrogenase alpha subunit
MGQQPGDAMTLGGTSVAVVRGRWSSRKVEQMAGASGKIDRRSLLQLIGAAGATMSVTACGSVLGDADAAGLPGGAELDGNVTLASAGPGGNKAWRPGDAAKFLPPEQIPTRGKAADLVAGLPKEKLHLLYQRMVAHRMWERAMITAILDGKDGVIGPFHPSTGQEATAVGILCALHEDDYVASTHRGHAHLIAKGADLNKMSAEIFFRQDGYNKGYGGSMHITDLSKGALGANGIVGASYYLAAGAALRGMVRGTKQVAVAYFGDGAAASPYYFSAVRSSANYKVPVLFVCENNFQWMYESVGISSPTKYLSDYTRGLGIPHHLVDGNDVTAVYNAAHEAAEWGRAGNGPSVIETVTYRWYDHAGFAGVKRGQDGAFGLPYRTDEEVRQWMSRDPITRYRQWLLKKDLTTEAELQAIDKRTQEAVDASVEFARKSPAPAPEAGLLNTYAQGPAEATQFYNRKGLLRPVSRA